MPNIYTNDGVYIAKVIRDHLNTWSKKPAPFLLEDIGTTVPSLMIQQLAAATKKTTYVNGSYIGVWNFAVYIRVSGSDTAERLDATGCLQELSEWLEKRNEKGEFVNLPEIDEFRKAIRIEMMNSPSIAERHEDGSEEYQAIFSLEYKVRRK